MDIGGGQARVVLFPTFPAVLGAEEAGMAAGIHLGRNTRVDDPAHRVRALEVVDLPPRRSGVVADRGTPLTPDHDAIGVFGVHRHRVEVTAHDRPFGRAGLRG